MLNLINGIFLQAEPAGGGLSSFTFMIPFIAVFAILYFLMIRPEQKKQKAKERKRKEMLENLAKGDKIATIGGIRGTIVSVKEKTVIVKVDENTKMEFSREAMSEVLSEKKESEEPKKAEPKKKQEKNDTDGAE